jgi:hypothetical protein
MTTKYTKSFKIDAVKKFYMRKASHSLSSIANSLRIVILLPFNGHLERCQNKLSILENLNDKRTKAIRQAI